MLQQNGVKLRKLAHGRSEKNHNNEFLNILDEFYKAFPNRDINRNNELIQPAKMIKKIKEIEQLVNIAENLENLYDIYSKHEHVSAISMALQCIHNDDNDLNIIAGGIKQVCMLSEAIYKTIPSKN